MNKRIIALVLTLVSIGICAYSQAPSTVDERYPMPTAASPVIAYVACATPTLTMGAAAKVIGTMPTGAKGVTVVAVGAVNYGDSSVDSSTTLGWPSIATGTSKDFILSPLHPKPLIYFAPTATGATPLIHILPWK